MPVFKLISEYGNVIGKVEISTILGNLLKERGYVQIMFPEPLRWVLTAQINYDATIKIAILAKHYSRDTHVEGVILLGATIEEFEMIPECYFTPSAAYIRMQIEESKKKEKA